MADGKSVTLTVKVPESLAAAVDEHRGEVSRSAWLQALITAELAGAQPIGRRVLAKPGGRKALVDAAVRRAVAVEAQAATGAVAGEVRPKSRHACCKHCKHGPNVVSHADPCSQGCAA